VTSHTIMRINPPNAVIEDGQIIFKGDIDLLKLSDQEMREIRGQHIALTFQDPMSSLNPVFTIAEQMIDVIKLHRKCSDEEAREIAIQEMHKVGIPDPETRIDDYPHQFSGGMRQRIILAQAFALQPELLVADEPTTALDVTIQAQVLEIIKRLREEYGMALVIITHDLGVVAEVTDRVHVFYGGTVVESGKTTEVFANPLHPYTRALISSIPALHDKREKLDVIPGTVPQLINPPKGCRFHPRCKYKQDKCETEKPFLRDVIFDERLVACHFAEDIEEGKIETREI